MILKLMIFLGFTSAAFGQTILSPEAAVSAALLHHPLTKAAALDVQSKKYAERSAFNIPNPELNVESPTGSFYTLGVSQSFDFPTVYVRQKQVAKAETSLALSSQRMNENELRYTVRSLYLETQASEYKSDQWRDRDSLYQLIAATAARQFDNGEIDFLQKTMAENEAGMVHQERLASEITTSSLRAQLIIFTGLEHLGDLMPLTSDSSEALFLLPDIKVASPAEAYQQQVVKVAEAQIALAKSRAMPNLSFGYMNQGDRPTPIDYRFRASMGIPLWAGQYLANQKVVKAERQAAMARAEAQSQAVALERQKIVERALTAQSKVQYNERAALPRSRSLIAAAMRMREAGQVDYVTFLRTLDEAFSIQLEYIEQLTALYATRLQMQYLSGN